MSLQLYYFLTLAGFLACLFENIYAANSTYTKFDSRNDQNRYTYKWHFRVTVRASEDAFGINEDYYRLFNDKLFTAFEGSTGFDHLKIMKISIGEYITSCDFKAYYNTTLSLPKLKGNINNIVEPKISQLYFFMNWTVFYFKMEQSYFQGLTKLDPTGKNSNCSHLDPPCSKEYVCVDIPLLSCIHRCVYEKEKINCRNGGHCFVDEYTDSTKCSCQDTDSYVYAGRFCEEKVEKLKLESTYIIAICAGVVGTIITILVGVNIVIHRKLAWASKRLQKYELTPCNPSYDDLSAQNMNVKVSLTGISADIQSGCVDIKLLEGRN